MKTIEERATKLATDRYYYGSDGCYWEDTNYKVQEACIAMAEEQKSIDKNKIEKIYNLYSQIEDDLLDGYLDSNWNGGMVEVDGKEESMAAMLDKIRAMFKEAMEE